VQTPRPPLTLAANGPRALGVVAELADAWNTWGGAGPCGGRVPVGATAARARTLEAHCQRLGRDPATIWRSLLVYHRFVDVWASTTQVQRLVEAFAPLGFTEYVFYWPRPEQQAVFEQVALEVLPALRGSPGRR
jgi:alkanesulfonate monooxygenase SsuD/methylene tetrahydromethanopterin reductase-like flavin-dependent oxidoreductase (luciferase family)